MLRKPNHGDGAPEGPNCLVDPASDQRVGIGNVRHREGSRFVGEREGLVLRHLFQGTVPHGATAWSVKKRAMAVCSGVRVRLDAEPSP
jgi:hypothetical protein